MSASCALSLVALTAVGCRGVSPADMTMLLLDETHQRVLSPVSVASWYSGRLGTTVGTAMALDVMLFGLKRQLGEALDDDVPGAMLVGDDSGTVGCVLNA